LSFFFVAASFVVLHAAQQGRFPVAARGVLVSLILWDLYAFNPAIRSKIEAQKNDEDFLAKLVRDRELADFLKAQPGMSRVHFDAVAPVNLGDAYRVPVIRAMSATLLVDYAVLLGHPRQNQLLNVRYTIRSKDRKGVGPPVFSNAVWDVHENPDALPRAWFVHHVEVDASQERPLKRLSDSSLDLSKTALVAEFVEGSVGQGGLKEKVEWVAYQPNTIELRTENESAGLLVLSEVYDRGWVAEVDDRPLKIYQVNGALRGLRLDPGVHRIVMTYQPRSVWWGATLSAATLVATVLIGAATFRYDPVESIGPGELPA
jgi:hypothetical protein